jgi:RimJ/RimL family protein N-acetyltransferase
MHDHLTLRDWQQSDKGNFAALHADPEVMLDYGATFGPAEIDAKFPRYQSAFRAHGFCRWLIENAEGVFLGYAGMMPSFPGHPLGPHFDIGWRLVRSAWGYGYATEAAKAALQDGFNRVGMKEVLAYTDADNSRSQAVIKRLELQRAPSLDFSSVYEGKSWRGLVWVARPLGR